MLPDRERLRSERCACGGAIVVAIPASDEEIGRAVWQHNHTVRHLLWAEAGGMDAPPPAVDAAYEGRLGR